MELKKIEGILTALGYIEGTIDQIKVNETADGLDISFRATKKAVESVPVIIEERVRTEEKSEPKITYPIKVSTNEPKKLNRITNLLKIELPGRHLCLVQLCVTYISRTGKRQTGLLTSITTNLSLLNMRSIVIVQFVASSEIRIRTSPCTMKDILGVYPSV